MPRYGLTIEYDGAPFAGWQRQRDQVTVQGVLEEALGTILREPVDVVGSGRTDSGVHAIGQVAHFDGPGDLDLHRLLASLNGLLAHRCQGAVVVLDVQSVAADFHARYDARQRLYHYAASGAPRAITRTTRWIMRPEPDWRLMNEAAESLIGEHDFGSFCLTQSETLNRVCTVSTARWTAEQRMGDWRFEISANRFLHGMVRAIVGTLYEIGVGKRARNDLKDVIAQRDRRQAGVAAPPHGLCLVRVDYGTTGLRSDPAVRGR